jgi:A/G-specific adenine glycosylase
VPATLTRRRFNRALLDWHARSARLLVMRTADTPWSILVAEVMSQQTQIERIGATWQTWMRRWPSPADLAAAPIRDVVTAWAGLGYNRRALALREAAAVVVRDHAGRVPATVAALETLPGIGPYTARAVAASAFGRPVAPLDVNVRRVLGRMLGPDVAASDLQARADELVSRRHARAWVNAVMDLAVTVCTRRAPVCGACPVRDMCASAGTAGEVRPPSAPATPFESTNRWLRGRLLAWAREAPAGDWVAIPDRLGVHRGVAVVAATRALARDGFLEIDRDRIRLRA